MRRLLRVGTLVVLVVTAAVLATGPLPVLGAEHDPGVAAPDASASADSLQQFDRTQFRIEVSANGSARFTIRHERQLANESERQQFQTFADDFESNQTELYSDFTRRARDLTTFGTNETGRNMTATDFRRSATIEPSFDQDVGVVRMSFRWTAFARTPDDRVVVDDVFEGGFYIGPSQSLVFEPGDGLAFEAVEPAGEFSGSSPADSDSVTWQGERSFSDQRPRVEFVSSSGGVGPTDSTTRPGSGLGSDSIPMLPVVAVLALVGIAGAAVWWRSRDDGAVDTAPGDAGAGAVAPRDEGDGVTPEPAVPDEELLTDEDRVVELLNENGGRMRQSDIVETTDWSKSKVSMLLSDMEDEGLISKLRVGRENIVSLAGHEPDAAGSPFEDVEGEDGSDDER
ncbi:helix-turn-helix transcriptional regulator [Haloarchaeobius sp. HRN-SO-5]|uniref:helix-turn-helix transcriptional regulator n=1 Tax=Haloarchaeobius sp. HRN-SO-5 TaxID=3446118 RepID=UPI003EB81616